jgi:hypothetical protein
MLLAARQLIAEFSVRWHNLGKLRSHPAHGTLIGERRGQRMRFRERIDFWSGLWIATGLVLMGVAWFNDEDRNFGLILMVVGVVFSIEVRLKREIQELRYRLGELEYKNEQAEQSRALSQRR